jgi:hypothetical protein
MRSGRTTSSAVPSAHAQQQAHHGGGWTGSYEREWFTGLQQHRDAALPHAVPAGDLEYLRTVDDGPVTRINSIRTAEYR